MKKLLPLAIPFLFAFIIVAMVYFIFQGDDKISVKLTKTELTVSLTLSNAKLPRNEEIEIHTSVLDEKENEVVFLRNKITEKKKRSFSWGESDLELKPGKYEVHTKLIILPKLHTPSTLLKSKTTINLK